MTVVRADRIEVQDRLSELGLTVEELHNVLNRAEAERRTCTGFDPPGLPGSVFWGRVVRYLRETYVPKGWKARNVDQLPLLINSDRTLAITASSGDWATGISALYTPRTRYPKGAATGRRVEANGQFTSPDCRQTLPRMPMKTTRSSPGFSCTTMRRVKSRPGCVANCLCPSKLAPEAGSIRGVNASFCLPLNSLRTSLALAI